MEKNYKEKLRHIHTFCFDVDGVFTDNIVYLGAEGDQMRTANVRDGYAVQLAVKCGLQIVIISGGKSAGVVRRFEGLGVQHIYTGISEKLPFLEQFLMDQRLVANEVSYMGDDIPDLYAMQHVGLACCPADAAAEIKSVAHYISPFNGGHGCVRDILEQALKVQGKWLTDGAHRW